MNITYYMVEVASSGLGVVVVNRLRPLLRLLSCSLSSLMSRVKCGSADVRIYGRVRDRVMVRIKLGDG